MERREYVLKVIETAVALVGLGGLFVGYLDYRGKAQLQALRSLHDAQLQTCRDVAVASARLFSSSDQQGFERALMDFAELKHGKGLVTLDRGVLDKMVRVYNHSLSLKSPARGEAFKEVVRRSLCNEPFEVVLECRRMLAHGF